MTTWLILAAHVVAAAAAAGYFAAGVRAERRRASARLDTAVDAARADLDLAARRLALLTMMVDAWQRHDHGELAALAGRTAVP